MATTMITTASSQIFVDATQVQWQGNDNVSPHHKAAHNAPRSQKYWDEHGIERPEYAMTEEEWIAKRRKQTSIGSSDDGRRRLYASLIVVTVGAILLTIIYANITGDWDTILTNPVGRHFADCIRTIMERAGISGHRLGSSSKIEAASSEGLSNEDNMRRKARLARFDNPKTMLDDMKMD